jgi:hypothetical protein
LNEGASGASTDRGGTSFMKATTLLKHDPLARMKRAIEKGIHEVA